MQDDPIRLVVPPGLTGTRFDRVLAELVPGHSGAQLQKLVRRGRVKIDGRRVVRSNFRVGGGERVVVHLDAPRAAEPALEWLHVEDAFAVANKPPGLLTHRVAARREPSVADRAVERFGALPCLDDDATRPGIVHRLDRDTSGVIVVARTDPALASLRDQFRARTVDKRYLAVVHGVPAVDRIEIDRPIGRAPGAGDRERVDPAGRPAHTTVYVFARGAAHALVECRPHTGRRHQIRVHLHDAGFPVVGDELYRPARPAGGPRPPHHALHAARIAFDHPVARELGVRRVEFEAAPPPAFVALRAELGLGDE